MPKDKEKETKTPAKHSEYLLDSEEEDADITETKKTFRVEPPSELLSRLQAFLPQIAEANKKMETDDPKDLDIENLEGKEGKQYIEMDLGLGVFDMKPKQTEEEKLDNIIIGRRRPEHETTDDGYDEDIVINPTRSRDSFKEKPRIEVLHSKQPDESDHDHDSDSDS